MIGKLEKQILIGIGAVAAVLVLLLTYYNSLARAGDRTINVSVIIDSPSDYLIKGMEKAARDYNVDTRQVNTVADQSEAILNELDNKADALILRAKYPENMQTFLSVTELIVPMITLDSNLHQQATAAHLGVNEQQLLESLVDVIKERAGGMPCIIVKPAYASMQVALRAMDLEKMLVQQGIEYIVVDSYLDRIAASLDGLPEGALICMDAAMLPNLCEQAREGDCVFSIGYNPGARQYLENDLIKALVMYSEYDMGYLSVKAAAQAVQGDYVADTKLPIYVVDGENMYKPPVNQILFPIE